MRSGLNASATPTQVGRQPPAGRQSGSRDVPCDLWQQLQIRVILFRSAGIVLAWFPFRFFRPSFLPFFFPPFLCSCLRVAFQLVSCPLVSSHDARSYLRQMHRTFFSLKYLLYTWLHPYFRRDTLAFARYWLRYRFQTIRCVEIVLIIIISTNTKALFVSYTHL